jgi:hypothetical protein
MNQRFLGSVNRGHELNNCRVRAELALQIGDRTRDVAAKLRMSLRDVVAAKKAMENPEPPPEHRPQVSHPRQHRTSSVKSMQPQREAPA